MRSSNGPLTEAFLPKINFNLEKKCKNVPKNRNI
jgi:hypothetical protein